MVVVLLLNELIQSLGHFFNSLLYMVFILFCILFVNRTAPIECTENSAALFWCNYYPTINGT
ncbi:hypothetical protein EGC77_07650 [Shewanella psychromarinicola]|uniref:Uncharacterized protein n=1 Tax=Shewanella psychromarinicola TaxID=2487742 RepID=A0A3N4E8D5_9GAMM|nr:hypothetical protein EGC77_07650 [Shewanella psychromarinicola]